MTAPKPSKQFCPDVAALEPILIEAATMFHVTPNTIIGRSQSATVSKARRWAMRAARERLGWSYHELGRAFGRDHSTVVYACQVDEQRAARALKNKLHKSLKEAV
jgi:chromosomal replication initiator protein